MRVTLSLPLVLVFAGCMPAPNGDRGAIQTENGEIPRGLKVNFGYGVAPSGAPRCKALWDEPPECPGAAEPVEWLAYQDGSGEGCTTAPMQTLEQTRDSVDLADRDRRWSAMTICEPAPEGCSCADDARCALPEIKLFEFSLGRFYFDNSQPSMLFSRRYDAHGLVAVGEFCDRPIHGGQVRKVDLIALDGSGLLRSYCYTAEGEVCCDGEWGDWCREEQAQAQAEQAQD